MESFGCINGCRFNELHCAPLGDGIHGFDQQLVFNMESLGTLNFQCNFAVDSMLTTCKECHIICEH